MQPAVCVNTPKICLWSFHTHTHAHAHTHTHTQFIYSGTALLLDVTLYSNTWTASFILFNLYLNILSRNILYLILLWDISMALSTVLPQLTWKSHHVYVVYILIYSIRSHHVLLNLMVGYRDADGNFLCGEKNTTSVLHTGSTLYSQYWYVLYLCVLVLCTMYVLCNGTTVTYCVHKYYVRVVLLHTVCISTM